MQSPSYSSFLQETKQKFVLTLPLKPHAPLHAVIEVSEDVIVGDANKFYCCY
jgi:hypothetical protein